MKKEVFILAAKRTPIGKFMGGLSSVPAPDLGAHAIRHAMESIALQPEKVDEVLMGNVLQAGVGQAPARRAALLAGLPETVPCTAINKVCASGMKSVMLAAQSILLGDAEVVIAGGMENMSMAPHFTRLRAAKKYGEASLEDIIEKDGLTDTFRKVPMGIFADECALRYKISRKQQDDYAIASYRKASDAWKRGDFHHEVCPLILQGKREEIRIEKDEEYTNIIEEKIPKLRPAFSKGEDATVTAANASTINDGAAALILMSKEAVERGGFTPLAKILSYADAAHAPDEFTTAPAKALPIALKKAGLASDQIDLFEINEAFAVVALANTQLLGLNPAKVNVNGGAVALGHPIGCSGARILVTLCHLLQKRGKYGAAAICNGGGGASAIVIENMN